MHPTSIFAQTPRLASCLLASRLCAQRKPPAAARAQSMARKKRRIRETRLGKRGGGDIHAEGGGACTRRTKKNDPSSPPCSCGAGPSRPRRAQCTRRDSALTSHVARVEAIGPCLRCAVWGRSAVLFLCGVEQTPVSMWRVVVVGGLFAQGFTQYRFGVVTGRVAVISRRSHVTHDPL